MPAPPPPTTGSRTRPIWPWVVVGVSVVGAECVGLYYLQQWLQLGFYLKGAPEAIRPYFLPILFLLLVMHSLVGATAWYLARARAGSPPPTEPEL